MNVFRIHKQEYHLRRILETFVIISFFETIQGSFSKKKTFFSRKNPKSCRFWEFLSNNTIWKASRDLCVNWRYWNLPRFFIQKNTFFPTKTQNSERFENSWAVIPFETLFRKNCHSERSWYNSKLLFGKIHLI